MLNKNKAQQEFDEKEKKRKFMVEFKNILVQSRTKFTEHIKNSYSDMQRFSSMYLNTIERNIAEAEHWIDKFLDIEFDIFTDPDSEKEID